MAEKLRRLEFLFRQGKLGLKPVRIFGPPRRSTESKNRHNDVFSVGVVFDGLRKHERVHLRRHNFRHSDTYANSGSATWARKSHFKSYVQVMIIGRFVARVRKSIESFLIPFEKIKHQSWCGFICRWSCSTRPPIRRGRRRGRLAKPLASSHTCPGTEIQYRLLFAWQRL